MTRLDALHARFNAIAADILVTLADMNAQSLERQREIAASYREVRAVVNEQLAKVRELL